MKRAKVALHRVAEADTVRFLVIPDPAADAWAGPRTVAWTAVTGAAE